MDKDEFDEALERALNKALNAGLPPSVVIEAMMAALVLSPHLLQAVNVARKVGVDQECFIASVKKLWKHQDSQASAASATAEILAKLKS